MSESATNPAYHWVHPSILSDLRADGRLDALDTTPIVASFGDAYEALFGGMDGAIIPKDCVDDPVKFGFQPTRLAIRWGALRTYRDSNPKQSVQLWEYADYYVARLNRYNPDRGRLVEHALTDKLHYTVGTGVAVMTAYELLRQWKQ